MRESGVGWLILEPQHEMVCELPEHLSKQASLNALAENLRCRGVMSCLELDTMDSLDFGLAQQSGTSVRLDKRTSIDLMVGLRNGRNPRCIGMNDVE